jgi:hypothetical protein
MYMLLSEFQGYPPIGPIVLAAQFAAQNAAGSLPKPGTIYHAWDNVFGGGEVVWARAGGAIRQFGLCVLTPTWDAASRSYLQNMSEVPNTANLGRALYVALSNGAMAAGDYGWFLRSGITPVNGTASVAADTTLGITAAGQVGANTAGKQLLNARVAAPATTTVVKAGTGAVGDNIIYVPDTDGLFVGGYMSGTGVGTNAAIVDMDPMGNWIRVSVVNSAAIAGNVTQTANNATIFYNTVVMDRPIAQGAIT